VGISFGLISRTGSSHTLHCSPVPVTTIPNILRRKNGNPQKATRQSFQIRSSGSPKIFCSRSGGVCDVLKTCTTFAARSPKGMLSPASVSTNRQPISGRITRSIQPFRIALAAFPTSRDGGTRSLPLPRSPGSAGQLPGEAGVTGGSRSPEAGDRTIPGRGHGR